MNRFTAKIVFAGLLAAQFAPAAAFAQSQPAPTQITPVIILRVLLKAASDAPAFTRARRGAPKDIVALFAREKGVSASDLPRLREEAAQAIARDIAETLRLPSVIEMLREEKNGVLGAVRAVSAAPFIAQALTRPFAPKPAPAKRVSMLRGIVRLAQAGDVPTDEDIKAAEKKVEDARNDVLDARFAGDKTLIAEDRAKLYKARAELAALQLKRSIANAVTNCSFDPKSYYSGVKRTIAPPIIDELLTRVGALINNPYDPELGKFQKYDIGRDRDISNVSDEQKEKMRDGVRKGDAGIADMVQAYVLLDFAQALKTFPADDKSVTFRGLLETILKKYYLGLESTILHELEKQGILNLGGLADAIDDFLRIQKVLLFEDIVALQKQLCAAKNAIDAEIKKIEAVLRAMEKQLERKLGEIGADSPEEKAKLDAVLGAYLNCSSPDSLNDLLFFVKSQIYQKIYDAIQRSTLNDVKRGLIKGVDVITSSGLVDVHVAFLQAVSGNNDAVEGLQKAADAAVEKELPGLLNGGERLREGVNRRLTIRLGILLLRNLQGYSADPDMLLMSRFRKTTVDFGKEWTLISGSPKLVGLQKLLFAIDEFVRRFKEIFAGNEGELSLKAQFCAIKAQADANEKRKEGAMENIEQKAKAVQPGAIPAPGGGSGTCTNPRGLYCLDRGSDVGGNRYDLCANTEVGRTCGLENGFNSYAESATPDCRCSYFCLTGPLSLPGVQNGPTLWAEQSLGCSTPGVWEQAPTGR